MLAWLHEWKERRALQKLARKVGPKLKKRYGFQEYYTPEQVLATAEQSGLDREAQAYAVAMYVLPENAQGVLRELGQTKLAGQVRAYMIGRCCGFGGGYDGSSDQNVFMHHSTFTSHHDGTSTDGSLGHSSDGGHSGGHSCGGHSCGGSH